MTAQRTKREANVARLRIALRGAVQGVGFRPFVYRLATEAGLGGWVNNSMRGVFIEVEGSRAALEQFRLKLETEKPPRSFIQSLEATWLDAAGYATFEIRESEITGQKTAIVLPDVATCPECVREIFDPENRRFHYPFTNCVNCGPRFTIINSLPYDRANTTMRGFAMCPACQAEYDDPMTRRFHAQPNACPVCGPHLELWERRAGASPQTPLRIARDHPALLVAAEAIRQGQIVAVKGVGGFHLMVDARNEDAIRRLRKRKHREEKPFAVMFPSLEQVKEACELSSLEERLLSSPEAPIILLRRAKSDRIAEGIAPNNPNLGAMLPSNPLHHLLMEELRFPVVATSGNLSDEPICTDEFEAIERLRDIADVFLVHNRPIVRHVDDSIVRVMMDREMVLRRARGFAPLPILLPAVDAVRSLTLKNECQLETPHVVSYREVLAVGAHLKNSVALAVEDQAFLSQHIGDLETEQALRAFRRVAADLPRLYEAQREIIAADLHPDYLSTRFALERSTPASQHAASDDHAMSETGAPQLIRVQHHVAHALACIAENEVALPALGVAWDGTGLGTDGTIWGGEFFRVTGESVERVAHWRPFRLPGGDAAAKEPRRAALGLLNELFGTDTFDRHDLKPVASFSDTNLARLRTMLERGINAPWCCSVGRLFDAVASLIGLRQQMQFEGQAAMELEFAAEGISTDSAYEFAITQGQSPMQLDWALLISGVLSDVANGAVAGEISARFHNALAEAIVMIARRAGCERVALSGGCFQNRYLTERAVRRLRAEGFQPYWHQRVPTNDGGIALGQVVAARRHLHAGVAEVRSLGSSSPEIKAGSHRQLQTTH